MLSDDLQKYFDAFIWSQVSVILQLGLVGIGKTAEYPGLLDHNPSLAREGADSRLKRTSLWKSARSS